VDAGIAERMVAAESIAPDTVATVDAHRSAARHEHILFLGFRPAGRNLGRAEIEQSHFYHFNHFVITQRASRSGGT
jgi:hypothetical protein